MHAEAAVFVRLSGFLMRDHERILPIVASGDNGLAL
jgi:hypothetical protein